MILPPLYPILDTATLERRKCPLVDAATAMIGGGARILQLRHKGHFSRTLFEQAERIGDLCRRFGVIWIIDDRADIAKLLGVGVHVGQEDLPPRLVRQILGPEAIVGYSTHNAGQLQQAINEPADYLALGPVFSTASKENPDPVVGLEELRHWRRLDERPLVAIGGITLDNAASVLAAGADSVAVIGGLLPGTCTRQSICERMETWQRLLLTAQNPA